MLLKQANTIIADLILFLLKIFQRLQEMMKM